jgi:tetratricopeptide (TPR) repeat protein
MRGTDSVASSPDVRIAVATIEKETARRQTAKNLHELGVAHLITGDISNATEALEKAVIQDSGSRALSDLSAAYLVRGMRENRPEDLFHALVLATQALQRDGTMREALFNRALALDQLSMLDDARRTLAARSALQGDSSMLEALNRATLLDRRSIVDGARQAWQAYLKVDGESGWAAEARISLQRLSGG